MNIDNLVEALYERSRGAHSAAECFIAEYFQFFLMVMLYEHSIDKRDSAERVRDMLPQILNNAFCLLALPQKQRKKEERKIFKKFQNRYSAIFGARPSDPMSESNVDENERDVLCRAMNIAEKLLLEFSAIKSASTEHTHRVREYPQESAFASAKFS